MAAALLVDAHTHVHACPRRVQRRILESASFSHIGVCGTSPQDWPAVLEFCHRAKADRASSIVQTQVVPYVGVHPWWAKRCCEILGDAGQGANVIMEPAGAPGREARNDYTMTADSNTLELNWNRDQPGKLPDARPASFEPNQSPFSRGVSELERRLERLLAENGELQVGEIGLDKLHGKRRKDFAEQRMAFRAQLKLAARFRRGVQVHCVQAGGTLAEEYDALENQHSRYPAYTLLHSYILGPDLVPLLLRKIPNVFFSFAYHKNVEKLAATLGRVPLESILVETDAPAQTPEVVAELCEEVGAAFAPSSILGGQTQTQTAQREQDVVHRREEALADERARLQMFCPCCPPGGRRDNTPENVTYVLAQVAACLGKSVGETASLVEANASRMYSYARR
eukprot:g7813.t1